MKRGARILVSALIICGAVGISVGSTLAVFSSTKTINNHIKAGSLKVGYYLTSFVYDTLGDDGMITPHTEDLTTWTGYDATVGGVDLKLFTGDVISVDKFCPDMSGYAIFKVINQGDIAFNYTFEVANKKAIWKGGEDKTDIMDSVFTIGVETPTSMLVKKGESTDTNKVSFAFLKDASNDWMESTFSFDVVLNATQITKE